MYDNVQTHKGVWNVKIVQTLVAWSFKDAQPENKTIYSIVIYLNQEQLTMCAITHFKFTSKMVYSLSSKKMSSNYNFSEIQRQENLNLLIMKRVALFLQGIIMFLINMLTRGLGIPLGGWHLSSIWLPSSTGWEYGGTSNSFCKTEMKRDIVKSQL